MDHPNIANLFETYEDAQNYYIVIEYCIGEELVKKINISEESAKKIMK